jgi:hypothetical protein
MISRVRVVFGHGQINVCAHKMCRGVGTQVILLAESMSICLVRVCVDKLWCFRR